MHITYCTYSLEQPTKPTVIFTNLPRGALPDRYCGPHTCQAKLQHRQHATVSQRSHAFERAKWPLQFVGHALRACAVAAGGQQPDADDIAAKVHVVMADMPLNSSGNSKAVLLRSAGSDRLGAQLCC